MSTRIAVFASGGGSNFQSLLDHFRTARHASIELLVTDRQDAGALQRAKAAGVAAVHVKARDRDTAEIEAETLAVLREHRIDFIALAGYLRLVPRGVTAAFRQRIVNIHPALLPAFGGRGMYGQRVHQAVLDAGCRITGATVHWVDERYDEGRIIAQWPVPVLPGDTAASLGARVLRLEHRLYPAAVAALARLDAGDTEAGRAGPALVPDAAAFRLTTTMEGLDAEIVSVAGL